MIEDKDYYEFIKLTTKLFKKYNLKEINCSIKTSHPLVDNQIIDKNMLYIKVKDINNSKLDDCLYDTLEKV